MHSIKFFAAGILAAIAVSRSHRVGGVEDISYLHYALMVSVGVGIFTLAGDGFGTAFADYDGTEHPWNHTHEVRFDRQNDVRLETESPYGLRHHESYDVVIVPPFHFSNHIAHIKIVDQTAIHGDDFSLYLPGSNNTKLLQLPPGVGAVPFVVSIRNDFAEEYDEQTFLLELYADKRTPFTVGDPSEMEVVILVGYSQTVLERDADPKRGIHIQPRTFNAVPGDVVNYTISLTSKPQSDVTVRVYLDINGASHDVGARPDTHGGLKVRPEYLTFTPINWHTPQTFSVLTSATPDRYVLLHGLRSDDRDYNSGFYFNGPGIIGHTHVVVDVAANSAPPRQEQEDSPRFPTSLMLSLGDASVSEGAGTATITATLNAPAPPGGVTMSPYSSGGNATDGTDYTLPGSIYISAGDRSGSATITITDDTVAESDERAVITVFAEIFGQAMTDSVTLTITDNDGVIVVEQTNRAPTISSAIADVTIPHEGGTRTISLAGVFGDADNDSLNITASSSDAAKAGVSVSSDYTSLTLTAKARGTATVTVTADDGNGGTVSDAFRIKVKAAPAVSSAISDVSGLDAGDSRTISLGGVFDDADGDSLAVTTTSSNGSVATVVAASDGSVLTITAQAPGTATIRVTAQDADGNRISDSFVVTVDARQPAGVPELDPMVARYDTDGSGAIEQDEWEVAVQDHADGKLTNENIYAISKARA